MSQYRHDSDKFFLAYREETPTRLSAWLEQEIEKELMLEKNLIDDSTLPVTAYNYSAIRDRLAKRGIIVAIYMIIDRAKGLGCYQPHPRKKAHDLEVITSAIGTLIQHDASHHRGHITPRAKGL